MRRPWQLFRSSNTFRASFVRRDARNEPRTSTCRTCRRRRNADDRRGASCRGPETAQRQTVPHRDLEKTSRSSARWKKKIAMEDRGRNGPFAVFEEILVDDGPDAARGDETTATTCVFSCVRATWKRRNRMVRTPCVHGEKHRCESRFGLPDGTARQVSETQRLGPRNGRDGLCAHGALRARTGDET